MHRVKEAHDALLASLYDESSSAGSGSTNSGGGLGGALGVAPSSTLPVVSHSMPVINTAAIASILEVDASEVALAPLSDNTALPHQVMWSGDWMVGRV